MYHFKETKGNIYIYTFQQVIIQKDTFESYFEAGLQNQMQKGYNIGTLYFIAAS